MGSKPVLPTKIKFSIIKANLFPSSMPKDYNGNINLKFIIKGAEKFESFEITNELTFFQTQFSLENDKRMLTLTLKQKVNNSFS